MPELPLDVRVAVVRDFLVRCRRWGAEREVPKHLARVTAVPDPAHASALHQWTTWVSFMDHALEELDAGKLDAWFDEE